MRMLQAGLVGLGVALSIGSHTTAQQRPSAAMLQFPDVSSSDIVFLYANDLWLVSREGGVARPLASPPGREQFPKFSPDGKLIAFVGNYDGNKDVYVMPVEGGAPGRLTHHPDDEVVTDWSPDGRVIYYTNAHSGLARQDQLYTVAPSGGNPERLPVPYGTTGSISPSGEWLAYTPHTHDFRTWKRYRGGWAQDLWIFNLRNLSSRKLTDWEGTDTIPMWQPGRSDALYYLSDDGSSHRLNIWKCELAGGSRTQVTDFKDYDVKWPSIGPGPAGAGEIVFQNGDGLYLLDLASGASRRVEVVIPGDRPSVRQQAMDASKSIQSSTISPTGQRLLLSARGDVWSVPAIQGAARNLTRTSGAAERTPVFSPDGKWIAYVSDVSGEYELYLMDVEGRSEARKLTSDGSAFRFLRSFSPDSRHLLFTDKSGAVFLHSLGGAAFDGSAAGSTREIAKDLWGDQNRVSWSHDSGWIALVLGHENTHNTVWLYEVASGKLIQVTHEMFDTDHPVFDRKGDWLYLTTSRSFAPSYSDLDSTWVYRNSQLLMALPLRSDVKNPLAAKSDEEPETSKKKDDEKPARDPAAGVWRGKYRADGAGADEATDLTVRVTMVEADAYTGEVDAGGQTLPIDSLSWAKDSKELTFVVRADAAYTVKGKVDGETISGTWSTDDGRSGVIDLKRDAETMKVDMAGDVAGFERRLIQLPVKPGGFSGLEVNDSGKLVYMRAADPPSETPGINGDIKLFDFLDEKSDKKEEKTVVAGVSSFAISADGKKLLVRKAQEFYVVDAAADQKLEKKAPTADLMVTVDPRAEWTQMFHDFWRVFRDYFYEPGMHRVDWNAQRDAYSRLLEHCASRDDATFVMAEMISELNVGHAYYRPGDLDEGPKAVGVGLLGADFELVKDRGRAAYRISRILSGGPWDTDARSPLAQPGIDAKEGDYILAVNGAPIDTSKDIYAAFVGMDDKVVSLTLSASPQIDGEARHVLVKTLSGDSTLRMRAWIEDNRRHVDERSEGRIGYIYVVNTGVPGQTDLVRQFYGQRHKEALIIDDRWNGGGQIPTRFIELLNRPRTNYWARRDGKDWAWPRDSHQGPKAMLINGLSASGGDMFPALFRQNGLGKLIGTRTWGGLVGISGNPNLIDGTSPNVPTFGYYQNDGTWGIEGHGVDPDLMILDDPAKMQEAPRAPGETRKVNDPQLDTAIDQLLGEIRSGGYRPPPKPAGPDRRGMGIAESDK